VIANDVARVSPASIVSVAPEPIVNACDRLTIPPVFEMVKDPPEVRLGKAFPTF
jgi:hypothetical protein